MHYAGALSCIDQAYVLRIRMPSGLSSKVPYLSQQVPSSCHKRVANECMARPLFNIRCICKS